jgi:hypothetical protein
MLRPPFCALPRLRAIPSASLRSLSWRGARRCRAFWRGGYLMAKQRMGRELKAMGDRLDTEMDELRAEFCDAKGELAQLHAIDAAATLMRERDFDASLH